MKTSLIRYLAVCLLSFTTTLPASAQSSATSISFQGALNGPGGQPLPNGSYTLVFQFWDHPTGTAANNRVGGAVTVPGVTVNGGVASTAIPVQPDWFNGQTRYLGTTVQGINAGQELLPRVLVTAVPYALTTQNVLNGALVQAQAMSVIQTNGQASIVIGRSMDPGTGTAGYFRLTGEDGFLDFETSQDGTNWLRALRISNDSRLEAIRTDGAGTLVFGRSVGSETGYVRAYGENGFLAFETSKDKANWTPVMRLENELNGARTTVNLLRATTIQITSARAAKEGFAPVDAAAVLAKVASLPIATWAYTNSHGVRHLGPVAEDFHAAFALGDSSQYIATVDADGVALAAIQGLHQLVAAQQTALGARESEVQSLRERLEKLERLVTELAGARKEGGK